MTTIVVVNADEWITFLAQGAAILMILAGFAFIATATLNLIITGWQYIVRFYTTNGDDNGNSNTY